MKIRHKHGYSDYQEVIEESASYYIVRNEEVLSKLYWEPVPSETWLDVTADCDIHIRECYLEIRHKNVLISQHGYLADGYRVRKVRGYLGGNTLESLQEGEAFIIEQRISP